jgi:hypothetical protein
MCQELAEYVEGLGLDVPPYYQNIWWGLNPMFRSFRNFPRRVILSCTGYLGALESRELLQCTRLAEH